MLQLPEELKDSIVRCIAMSIHANMKYIEVETILRSLSQLKPIEEMRVFSALRFHSPDSKYKMGRYRPECQLHESVDYRFKPGFLEQAKIFIECFVKKIGRNDSAATLRDALRVTRLCEAIEGTTHLTKHEKERVSNQN